MEKGASLRRNSRYRLRGFGASGCCGARSCTDVAHAEHIAYLLRSLNRLLIEWGLCRVLLYAFASPLWFRRPGQVENGWIDPPSEVVAW